MLDLQTKTVRPYRPQDLVSKSVGFEIVTWESIPSATKTELETVLAQLWPDEDQRDFMIRLNAQTLDGSVRKYVLCSIGPSNSGKSLDGELLRAALGREAGYMDTVTTRSLSTEPPAQEKPNTEVIGLEGKRLASQFEADLANAKPSVPKLQSWSGGDPIPVREARAPMNRDPPVTPTWQLHVASNSTPDASRLDDSLRDRFVIDIRRCRFASEPAEERSVFSLRSVHTAQGPKPLKEAIQKNMPYRTADNPSLPQHDLPKAYLALLISKYDPQMTTIDVRMASFELTPDPHGRVAFRQSCRPLCRVEQVKSDLPPVHRVFHETWKAGRLLCKIGAWTGDEADFLEPGQGWWTPDGQSMTRSLDLAVAIVYAREAATMAKRAAATATSNFEADTLAATAPQNPAAARTAAKAAFQVAKVAAHRARTEVDSVSKQAAIKEAIDAAAAAAAAVRAFAPPPPPQQQGPPGGAVPCAICGENPQGANGGNRDWRPPMGSHRCVRCGRYWLRHQAEWHAGIKRGGARQ